MYVYCYLHVNVVHCISDVLEDGFERHEEVTVLEAVFDPGIRYNISLGAFKQNKLNESIII